MAFRRWMGMGLGKVRGDVPLLARAVEHGHRLAVVDERGGHTYRGLLAQASAVAAAVRRDGCGAGAAVALLTPPDARYVAGQWGAWLAGALSVPVGAAHPPAEVAHVLRDSGARVALVAGGPAARATMDAAVAALPGDAGGGAGPRVVDLDALLAAADPRAADRWPHAHAALGADLAAEADGAYLVYTSGTTGRPKGVLTTHANVAAQVRALLEAWEWSPDDRVLNVLPLHHVHGMMCVVSSALWKGAVVEMPAARFDAAAVWDRIVRGGRGDAPPLTLFMAVPTVYARLIAEYDRMAPAARRDASAACRRFRVMVSGSMALPEAIMRRWEEISGHVLLERYGMSEFGMALSNPLHGVRRPGHVGFPLPGVEIRVDAPDAAGAGELLVRGPHVFRRYWNRPDATAEAFSPDGFFRTGDIAQVHADLGGSVQILGRASVDILKSGGYKLSALDIERALLENAEVAEVAVVGCDDPALGQSVEAVLVRRPRSAADARTDEQYALDLRSWCESSMARYKVPRRFHVWPEIPRNAMGKVNKKELVKLLNSSSPA